MAWAPEDQQPVCAVVLLLTDGNIHGPFLSNFRGGCSLPTQFHFNARFLCPLSCSTKVMREIKRPVLEIIPPHSQESRLFSILALFP
jgi:hypothetical protein